MQTKSEMINRIAELAKENAELKAENDRLKKENKVNLSRSLGLNREIQNLSVENAELKAENERLLKQKNNVTRKNIVFYTTLQEIKTIAEYSIMHNENLNSNYQIILQLITKAEEE